MGHESYARNEVVRGPSNRSFGLMFAAAFALIGLLPVFVGRGVRIWGLLAGAVFLLLALALPSFLGPLNRIWMQFGLLLHRIVNPVVLGFMFFFVVTPIGLLIRLFGKDPLHLTLDRRADSYWVERKPPGPPPETLTDQF